jgi:flagellin
MIINHNIPALNTHRMLTGNNLAAQKSMEKLSSGLRINRAGDDAAGLAISEKMRAQIRGLNQATRNAQDGISLIQTAEGALQETHAILQRMRELAVQAANDTNTDVDRDELQKEVNQLAAEISRIADTTEFNTKKLLNGSFTKNIFHIGANEGQNISLDIGDMSATSLGVGFEEIDSGVIMSGVGFGGIKAGESYSVIRFADTITVSGTSANYGLVNSSGQIVAVSESGTSWDVLSAAADLKDLGSGTTFASGSFSFSNAVETGTVTVSEMVSGQVNITATGGISIFNQADADDAITIINNAIETVSAERAKLGAYQNRLEHTINNLGTSAENLQAAESRIRDVDMAREIMEFTRSNILSQASQAMLAQANQLPQAVLQLLG